MNPTVEARVVHRFRASAEQVFDAWLDPSRVRVWMAAALQTFGLPGDIGEIEIDARVGGTFLFTDRRAEGEARHWGTYLELERPCRIVFTWIVDKSEEASPSVVTFEVEADGDGCVVTLTHRMEARWAEYIPQTESGWSRMLAAMEHTL